MLSLRLTSTAIASFSPVVSRIFARTMSVSRELMESKLKEDQTLQANHVEVVDTSGGCGASFEVLVVSSAFEGKTLIKRHRLVNSAVENELKEIHAFSQRCFTPAQWDDEQKRS